MLRLIIMRHADAEPPRGRRDHARPLSKTGHREAAAAGRDLAAAGLVPEIALVSDSVRTLATFDDVAAAFPGLARRVLPELYAASPATLLAKVRDLDDHIRVALVIGHNPGIGDFARSLAKAGDDADRAALKAHFPTACRAVVALDAERWQAAAAGRLTHLFGAKPA